jgi:hypothetical protein
MFIYIFYFFVSQLCKIVGLSFSFSSDGEDYVSCNVYPWAVCVEELGQTAETLKNGEIYKLMIKNGYIFGLRAFYSSIYILKNQLSHLPSPYLKDFEI